MKHLERKNHSGGGGVGSLLCPSSSSFPSICHLTVLGVFFLFMYRSSQARSFCSTVVCFFPLLCRTNCLAVTILSYGQSFQMNSWLQPFGRRGGFRCRARQHMNTRASSQSLLPSTNRMYSFSQMKTIPSGSTDSFLVKDINCPTKLHFLDGEAKYVSGNTL